MSELLIRAFKDQKRPSQHNVSGQKFKLNCKYFFGDLLCPDLKNLEHLPKPGEFHQKTGLILIVIISQPSDKMFLMKKKQPLIFRIQHRVTLKLLTLYHCLQQNDPGSNYTKASRSSPPQSDPQTVDSISLSAAKRPRFKLH